MGEYNVDFTKDEIIIDGHKFVKTDLPGIFKCTDDYRIYGGAWSTDVRNKDISILVKVKRGCSWGFVLYAYRFDNVFIKELSKRVDSFECDSGDRFIFAICAYNSFFDNHSLCVGGIS